MSSFLARRATAAPQFARAFSSTSARPIARISIVGTLGATPEMQTTPSGREVMRYSIASNTMSRGEKKTSWFRITAFRVEGARREFYESLPKGTLVMVEGEANMSTYQDAEGKIKSNLNIIQRSLDVLRRATPREPDEKTEGEGEEDEG